MKKIVLNDFSEDTMNLNELSQVTGGCLFKFFSKLFCSFSRAVEKVCQTKGLDRDMNNEDEDVNGKIAIKEKM